MPILALAAITLPAAVPASAITDLSTMTPAAGVRFISSSDFPEGGVGPEGIDATFVVVAESSDAKRLSIRLDGRPLVDRSFTSEGLRARSQFKLRPTPGWHQVSVVVKDSRGRHSRPYTYDFGVRDAPLRRNGAAAPVRLGGRFVEADGSPAINLPVAIYPMRLGASDASPPLAVTRTRADGMWYLEISALPLRVRQLAADNDGVLNLQAVAEGFARGPRLGDARTMFGVASLTAGVVSADGRMTQAAIVASLAAAPSAPLLPVLRGGELPTASVRYVSKVPRRMSAEDAEFYTAPLFRFEAADGPSTDSADPQIVGSADYTHQSVNPPIGRSSIVPGSTTDRPRMPGDQCYIENALVTKRLQAQTQYTRMLEGHAAQDAYASVSYSSTAGSSLSTGISHDLGKHWAADGSMYIGNSMGFSSGYSSKGPNFAYEWRMPVRYGYYKVYQCKMINGVKKLAYRYSAVRAEKVTPTSGGAVGLYGKNVSSDDGYYGYRDAPFKGSVYRGTDFSITRDKSLSYSAGASAYGFSVTATTSKSATRMQAIHAGDRSLRHYIFGYSAVGPRMKVFYSY